MEKKSVFLGILLFLSFTLFLLAFSCSRRMPGEGVLLLLEQSSQFAFIVNLAVTLLIFTGGAAAITLGLVFLRMGLAKQRGNREKEGKKEEPEKEEGTPPPVYPW